jgi:hypothetical protein
MTFVIFQTSTMMPLGAMLCRQLGSLDNMKQAAYIPFVRSIIFDVCSPLSRRYSKMMTCQDIARIKSAHLSPYRDRSGQTDLSNDVRNNRPQGHADQILICLSPMSDIRLESKKFETNQQMQV